MRWNPYLSAAGAAAYIGGIVLVFSFIESARQNTPDTPIDGVFALSLLVFSVATMAFLFFYHPLTLLLDNKRNEAVSYFLKTLGSFGVLILLAFILIGLQ